MSAMASERVFREYIGAQHKQVTFDHIDGYLREAGVDKMDLILAFAVDYDKSGIPTGGVFEPFWDPLLDNKARQALKKKQPNVRVMLSIGGDSILRETVSVEFLPATPDKVNSDAYAKLWIENAAKSLEALMIKYDLDGIDINYEHFNVASKANVDKFVYCIQSLLRELREKFPNMVTSIAPFYGDNVQANYQALWTSCCREAEAEKKKNLIDYVNFQFYSGDRRLWDSQRDRNYATAVYEPQVANYPGAKVLLGVKTERFDTKKSYWLDARIALAEADRLQRNNRLSGIFMWSADSSYVENKTEFPHEKQALKIVSDPTPSNPRSSGC